MLQEVHDILQRYLRVFSTRPTMPFTPILFCFIFLPSFFLFLCVTLSRRLTTDFIPVSSEYPLRCLQNRIRSSHFAYSGSTVLLHFDKCLFIVRWSMRSVCLGSVCEEPWEESNVFPSLFFFHLSLITSPSLSRIFCSPLSFPDNVGCC